MDRFSWGDDIMELSNQWHTTVQKYSFARIPNALFEYSGVLGLLPEELGFVCMLLSHMRYKNIKTGEHSKIYPSLSKLATMKFDDTSRQRLGRIKDSLEAKGVMRTIEKKEGNFEYDLSGLFALLYILSAKDLELKGIYSSTSLNDTPASVRELAGKDRIKKLKSIKDEAKKKLGL